MTQEPEPTAEPETRRGVLLYRSNPFLEAGLVKARMKRITNKRGDMMVMQDSGEIVAPVAGFWHAEEVDTAKFIKLYVNGVKAFKDLKGPGTKVFELLYLEMQRNIATDRVFMSFSAVDQTMNPVSMATYKRGMAELIAKGFLAPTPVQGWYWLNPDFVFNGDRLAFVRQYRRAGGKFADPRQEALPFVAENEP
jgi:hypothetical protein